MIVDACPQPRRRTDSAFTMIEIIVVMVIIAILLTLFVSGSRRVRTISARHHAADVAKAYDESVRSFQGDHDGRPPDPQRPTAEWRSSGAAAGPLDTMRSTTTQPVPYLGRHLPEDVREGRVGIQVGGTGGGAAGTTGTNGTVTYRYDRASATYDLTAQVDDWTCLTGTSARAKAAGVTKC